MPDVNEKQIVAEVTTTGILAVSYLSALLQPQTYQPSSLAVFEIANRTRPEVVFTLPFAEQVRRALIRNRADTTHSEAITGKTVDGTPLEGHEHAHYLPTDEDGDGLLDHLTIFCPRGFDEADVRALKGLRTIYRSGNRPSVRLVLLDIAAHGENRPEQFDLSASTSHALPRVEAGETGYARVESVATPMRPLLPSGTDLIRRREHESATTRPLLRGGTDLIPRWERDRARTRPLSQAELKGEAYRPVGSGDAKGLIGRSPAELKGEADHPLSPAPDKDRAPSSLFAAELRWRSVTPFSLPRFPNRGGGKPPRPRDLPEAQLVRELKNRGLPEPLSIKRIEGYQPIGKPLVRWPEFHTTRFKGTHGNGLAGFEIEFAEPVAGPIAVGFGCHFGLGLFFPTELLK